MPVPNLQKRVLNLRLFEKSTTASLRVHFIRKALPSLSGTPFRSSRTLRIEDANFRVISAVPVFQAKAYPSPRSMPPISKVELPKRIFRPSGLRKQVISWRRVRRGTAVRTRGVKTGLKRIKTGDGSLEIFMATIRQAR